MKSTTLLILLVLQLKCFSQNNVSVWENSSPMSMKRAFHTMSVACGNLYVMGGSTGEKNEFRDAALNSKIYAIGGRETLSRKLNRKTP